MFFAMFFHKSCQNLNINTEKYKERERERERTDNP